MDKQKQKMRFTDKELSLIKNTFCGKEELLVAIRKFIIQLPLTVDEKKLIASIQENKEVLAVIRKAFLPELDGDAPINQVVDLWLTIDLKDKTPEQAVSIIKTRKILISFIEQQLSQLEGVKPETIKTLNSLVKSGKTEELIARNTVISHTEQQLQMFTILAGLAEETVEQTMERLQKNSSK